MGMQIAAEVEHEQEDGEVAEDYHQVQVEQVAHMIEGHAEEVEEIPLMIGIVDKLLPMLFSPVIHKIEEVKLFLFGRRLLLKGVKIDVILFFQKFHSLSGKEFILCNKKEQELQDQKEDQRGSGQEQEGRSVLEEVLFVEFCCRFGVAFGCDPEGEEQEKDQSGESGMAEIEGRGQVRTVDCACGGARQEGAVEEDRGAEREGEGNEAAEPDGKEEGGLVSQAGQQSVDSAGRRQDGRGIDCPEDAGKPKENPGKIARRDRGAQNAGDTFHKTSPSYSYAG